MIMLMFPVVPVKEICPYSDETFVNVLLIILMSLTSFRGICIKRPLTESARILFSNVQFGEHNCTPAPIPLKVQFRMIESGAGPYCPKLIGDLPINVNPSRIVPAALSSLPAGMRNEPPEEQSIITGPSVSMAWKVRLGMNTEVGLYVPDRTAIVSPDLIVPWRKAASIAAPMLLKSALPSAATFHVAADTGIAIQSKPSIMARGR